MARFAFLAFSRRPLFLTLVAAGLLSTTPLHAEEEVLTGNASLSITTPQSTVSEKATADNTDAAALAEDDILARALLPPVQTAEDLLFIDAWKASQKTPTEALDKQMVALQGYPLYDYLVLAQMNTALKRSPSDPELENRYMAFIKAHPGEYLAERAATDFLLIAGKTLTAAEFNRIYDTLQWNKEEPPLLVAYSALNPNKVSLNDRYTLYRDTSYRGDFLGDLGNTLQAKMSNWSWTAFLIAMQKQRWNDARAFLTKIDKKTLPGTTADIAALLSNPSKWLKKNEPKLAKSPRLAMIAALRLAPANSEQAATYLSSYGEKLSKEERNMAWATVGYHGATDLVSGASGWYSQISGAITDNKLLVQPEIKLGWAIRAALWSARWDEVERLTRRLPDSMKDDEAWTYWRARAFTQLKQPEKAQPLYTKLANHMTFYGKLSDDMLNVGYYLPKAPEPVALTPKEMERWKNDPSIIKAQTFYRLEMYFMGHREWNWAMRNLKSQDLAQLATYAKSQALMHRMVNTAQRVEETAQNLDLLFPMPHRQQFEPLASSAGVPLAWVYGVIRQESRFMPSVTSSAGAQGLMQIMPRTARWLVKKLDMPAISTSDLHDLNTNVQLGSSFLAMLRNDLSDSVVLATAAYNAGPGRAKKWRSLLSGSTESAIFIENIPFNETRDYVKNVMANTHTYSLLDGHTKLNFTQLIDKIDPNGDTQTDLP